MAFDPRSLAQEAIELEQLFQANNYRGKETNPCPWVLVGSTPVVISAPHAVMHPRRGQQRENEPYTGPLALQLHATTGASAIIYARTTAEDPNYDKNSPYKEALKELVQEAKNGTYFVLDLHGLAKTAKRDVILGTAQGGTILSGDEYILGMLIDAFSREGINNIAVDEVFAATNPYTVAFYTARELKRTALQLEIHRGYRNPRRDPDKYVRLFQALWSVIMSRVPPPAITEEFTNE